MSFKNDKALLELWQVNKSFMIKQYINNGNDFTYKTNKLDKACELFHSLTNK